MQRSKSLGEFVPEIERFLHKRKRVARNNIAMAERTLKEYATPSTEEPQAIIVYPTAEGTNFEIKPAPLNLVQQNQFSGSPAEDPNLHILTFLRLIGTLKVNQEAVRRLRQRNMTKHYREDLCFEQDAVIIQKYNKIKNQKAR